MILSKIVEPVYQSAIKLVNPVSTLSKLFFIWNSGQVSANDTASNGLFAQQKNGTVANVDSVLIPALSPCPNTTTGTFLSRQGVYFIPFLLMIFVIVMLATLILIWRIRKLFKVIYPESLVISAGHSQINVFNISDVDVGAELIDECTVVDQSESRTNASPTYIETGALYQPKPSKYTNVFGKLNRERAIDSHVSNRTKLLSNGDHKCFYSRIQTNTPRCQGVVPPSTRYNNPIYRNSVLTPSDNDGMNIANVSC